MDLLGSVKEKIFSDRRFKYLLTGGSSTLLEYVSFILLHNAIRVPLVVSNIVSFCIGFMYTFILHNFWTFAGKHRQAMKIKFVSYAVLATINIVLTSLLIKFIVYRLGIWPSLAKLICMGLVVLWNYLLLNRVIFKRVD